MKGISIIAINLFLTFSCFGQNLIEKYPEIENEKIGIDQNDSLKTIKFENEEFMENITDGGGQLVGLYDNNGIVRKIEVIVYKSFGAQEYDFYLTDESPILIEDRFKRFAWDKESNSFDYSKYDGGFHGTYIFQENKLIDQISLGHNRFEDDQIDAEQVFLSEYRDYLKKIKKRLISKD